MTPTEQLKAFARGKTHGGYIFAAVCNDGELLCESCVRSNYRLVLRATNFPTKAVGDWQVVGLTNSGESEEQENCVHCGKLLWEVQS